MTLSIVRNAPLQSLNTFGVAASAGTLITLDNQSQLAELRAALADGPAPFVLGGGSNVLFTADVPGTILRVRLRGIRIVSDDRRGVLIEAAAGEDWDGLVRWSLAQRCYGLENLALIPGSAGAAPIQNIGAYGVELSDIFDSLDAVDLESGASATLAADDCAFGYRDSVFKRPGGPRWLVLRVRLRLSRTTHLRLDHGDIGRSLNTAGVRRPTPYDVAEAVRRVRRAKLPDPTQLGNAGSFFKNPIVSIARAGQLLAEHPDVPNYPAVLAGVAARKLSAAWLIEACGWKGMRKGDAGVDARHALVLVNHGEATGAQLIGLAARIRASVQERFGVRLEAEAVLLPTPAGWEP